MAVTQRGYGVVVPRDRIPVNRGASTSDGIYLTSTETGASRLLVSIDRIVREAVPALSPARFGKGDFFGFHVKWNPQGTRLMFVLRWLPRSWLPWKRKKSYGLKQVITMDADGGNIRVAVPADLWAKGGHHPNWCPDGDHIVMNLNPTGRWAAIHKAALRRHQPRNAGRSGAGIRTPNDAPERAARPVRRLHDRTSRVR
jgi:hypothetical protein